VERVVILGCGGAGKSTLARQIAARTGLPVVYLDRLFWAPGWTPAPEAEARAALDAAAAGERWILDGEFLLHEGGELRFARADTVVFLDLPRRTCLRRALTRLVRHRRRARPDLPEGCRETVDLPFLRWIWTYGRRRRPRILQLLQRLDGTAVYRLRSPVEVRQFLDALPDERGTRVAIR
jgi:adenylate kinase family enzyme